MAADSHSSEPLCILQAADSTSNSAAAIEQNPASSRPDSRRPPCRLPSSRAAITSAATNLTVEQYGRPIAFAFAGEPPQLDGANVFLSADWMAQSVNYRSVQEGLAYPTYYRGLFPDLRAAFTVSVKEGRDAGRNIWAEDVTNVGFDVTGLQSVTEQHVILPKLFRRLVEYLRGGGTVAQFKEFLEANPEPITVLSSRHFTHFDNTVEVLGDRVRLTELPENIVFNP